MAKTSHLGGLGDGTFVWLRGTNRAGTIVGESATSGGVWQALVYTGGVMTDLAHIGVMKWIAATISVLLFAGSLQAKPATIVQNGRSDYQIVTPEDKSQAVEYAAQELQRLIQQITGVRLPVVSEKRASRRPAFLLGPCRRSVKAGLNEQVQHLREDGVLLKTVGKDIALLGVNERGNLYSVYVLVEKFLGVRFLAWDCTVVPKQAVLKLPELDYSYSPPFMYRETLYFNSFPTDIAARQRLNGPNTKCNASTGGKIDFFPYVHSSYLLVPEERYFKNHPEYYGLQGGKRVAGRTHTQLCLSNPEVLEIAKATVFKWIEEHPDVSIIDVSQNDGNGACECAQCMAIVKEEASQHGPILRFVNAIADEVAKKHPDKWIETLAYAYSVAPPALTKPRTNVIIRLCHAGCFFHGFEQCGLGSQHATWLDQWQKLTQRIFIWHYGTAFNHYLAPNPNLNGLAKDIKYYAAHGVNGLMVQCNYQGPGGELAELRQYLCAQLMWDPTQNPMEIREDFCRHYYEGAAPMVLEFLQQMDRLGAGPAHAFAVWDPQSIVSPECAREALQTLERARAAGNATVRNRVDKLMLPFWYTTLLNPAKYGLSDQEAAAVWQQTRQTLVDNHITFIRESGLPDGDAAGWILELDARFAPTPRDLVFDLMKVGRAKTKNCADWRISSVQRNGHLVRTLFQHPDGKNDADATYEIPLPALAKGKKLLLKFGTVISNKTQDGVRFSVLVNGSELWRETTTTYLGAPTGKESAQDSLLPGQDPFSDHSLDLSKYAAQTIKLTLRINALENNMNDWANWAEPRIVEEPLESP